MSFNSSSYSASENDGIVNVYVDVFGSSEITLQPFFMTINNGTARGFDNIFIYFIFILGFFVSIPYSEKLLYSPKNLLIKKFYRNIRRARIE